MKRLRAGDRIDILMENVDLILAENKELKLKINEIYRNTNILAMKILINSKK